MTKSGNAPTSSGAAADERARRAELGRVSVEVTGSFRPTSGARESKRPPTAGLRRFFGILINS